MEQNRRNPKYRKEHWADTKARMQKSCYREAGIPLRDQWTLTLIRRCGWMQRRGCKHKDQGQPKTHPFVLPHNLNI